MGVRTLTLAVAILVPSPASAEEQSDTLVIDRLLKAALAEDDASFQRLKTPDAVLEGERYPQTLRVGKFDGSLCAPFTITVHNRRVKYGYGLNAEAAPDTTPIFS